MRREGNAGEPRGSGRRDAGVHVRRQLVVAYVVLHIADLVVVALSDDLFASIGLLEAVIAVALAVGLWQGRRLAWQLAVALEALILVALLLLLAVPWGAAVTAVVALTALRLAILLQRPLRRPPRVTHDAQPRLSA